MRWLATTWRELGRYWLGKGWAMRLVFAFDALIVLVIVLLPVLHFDLYNAVQLGVLSLFLAMFAADVGLGRDGEAFSRHHGRRLALDHLVALGLAAGALTLSLSSDDPVFHWAWLVAAAGFLLVYLLEATGTGPRHRAKIRAEDSLPTEPPAPCG